MTKEPITRARFRKATGFPPEQDDLERCNCDKVGQIGHFLCGWDFETERPRFWPKIPHTIGEGAQ